MDYQEHIFSGKTGWNQISHLVNQHSGSGIFILMDENTRKFCLPILLEKCSGLDQAVLIKSKSGDENKTILNINRIWEQLSENHALRSSLLLCLGGGVISDMGGFAGATFKRGIHFVHIPTTMLAMVDAAIGGKTGVNLNSIKNQVGVFDQPDAIFIFTEFLHTLPVKQKLSGYAEVIKHAMIDSKEHFDELMLQNSPEKVCNDSQIIKSANVKVNIVQQDPHENGLRKVLNYGHTIGHAVESFSHLNDPQPLSHGEAIAVGLLCESFISMRLLGFPENDLKRLSGLISDHFAHYHIKPKTTDLLLGLMAHDKKNFMKDKINFTLLKEIGVPILDQTPSENLIRESLHFYENLDIDFFI